MPSGKAAYRITDAAPPIRFDDHGIETENATTRVYHIDEDQPETAQMNIQRDIEVSRGDWRISTHVVATIVSDEDFYRSDITLTAKHNDEVVVERTFRSENRRFPPAEDPLGVN